MTIEARRRPRVPTGTVPQIDPPSFCIECDAPVGGCNHLCKRYHESYMDHPDYKPGSGQVPAEFRDWFDRPDHSFGPVPEPKARDLKAIVSGLERFFYLDQRLQDTLGSAYERAPLRVSQLTAEIQQGCESGRLNRPTGLLLKLLKELADSRSL